METVSLSNYYRSDCDVLQKYSHRDRIITEDKLVTVEAMKPYGETVT